MTTVGYVIHLRRAAARLTFATDLRDRCGVPCDILDASDGSKMRPDQIANTYQQRNIAPAYPFALSPGEIGCFLSHRTAWLALLQTKADCALILEDDMQIDDGFAASLELAQRHIDTFGYIQLQTRAVTGEALDQEGPAKLFRPVVSPLRTSGQLVSRAAAEKLLALSQPFDRPVDTFLQMHWHTGIQVGAIAPSGLVDAAPGSTISSTKPLGEKLLRSWRRFTYRRRVAQLSKKAAAT